MADLQGFISFVRSNMGITAAELPDDSPDLTLAYGAAAEWVNRELACVMPHLYSVAVYNLAASFLVNWGSTDVLSKLRESLKLNSFVTGPISASSDNSTSQTRITPDFYKNLSLADLQMLRDPWGRAYLMIAEQFGSLWGLN